MFCDVLQARIDGYRMWMLVFENNLEFNDFLYNVF